VPTWVVNMGGTSKLPWEAANVVAEAFIHHMTPHAERIAVAGSLRRHKDEVGDIEIVMIPKTYQEKNLLGEPDGPMLDTIEEGIESYIRCESLPDKPALRKLNDGQRYLKLHEDIVGVQIDLFIVRPPAQWGPIISIRTGSADFSKRLVIALRTKGLRCEDGRVLDGQGKVLSCPEEIDFFRACGVKMINPINR